MNLRLRLATLAGGVAIMSANAVACSCGGIHGRTLWEKAEKEAEESAAIFEGTPVRFSVQMNLLKAKSGDWVPADQGAPGDQPHMRITFRVTRVYKGNLGSEVQVYTGMGGGDCGTRYETGMDHLVYASTPSHREFWTSICTPGGWLGSNYVATEIRHLRHERPLASDLAPVDYRSPAGVARMAAQQEEYIRQYKLATGEVCGVMTPAPASGPGWPTLAFVSTVGSSPFGSSQASVGQDGKFCSGFLGPGRYYLRLQSSQWDAYHPSVGATMLEVRAGEHRSDVVFRVPSPSGYTVRGFVSTNDKGAIGPNDASVLLISGDGTLWLSQTVDFKGSWPLPGTKYFAFENVPPGRYIACAHTSNGGWVTKVVEVNVTSHARLIFLELTHPKRAG